MSSTTNDKVPPPRPPPRPEKVPPSPADVLTYDSTTGIDSEGDREMGATESTGAPRHTHSRPLPPAGYTEEGRAIVQTELQQIVRQLQESLEAERAKSRSLAQMLEAAKESLKLTTRKLELASAEGEDFRRRWKQSAKELRQQRRPQHVASQITDDDLTTWAKQLRLEVRDFSIQHFEADPHSHMDLDVAMKECQRARFYDVMEDTTPGTTDFKAFLSSPTRRSIVIQSFVWHLLTHEVFNQFCWAGKLSCAVRDVNTYFHDELIIPATQTDTEAMKRFKLWNVSTAGLVINCGAREACKHDFQAENERVLQLLVSMADSVISAFLKPGASDIAYILELEKIIARAIRMDQDIFGQAADVTWEFGDSQGAVLFDETTMALEMGEKAPKPGAGVVLFIAPAMYKLGRSNGDDFDQPKRLVLEAEVTCEPA